MPVTVPRAQATASERAAQCASCGAALHGRYCHQCGERVVTAEDMRVRRFAADAVNGAFDVDSRLWRSLRLLLLRPGELTAEHMRGRRRPYLGPLQVFLLANLVFFAALSTIGGFNTFTTNLENHLQMTGYGELATSLVERRVPADGAARATYVERFDGATRRYANSLVIVMVPLFALLVAAVYGRGRFLVHHLVFSLHFYAWLLFLLIAVPLAMRLAFLVLGVFASDETVLIVFDTLETDETVLGVALLSMFMWYLTRALQRAYQDRLGPALVRAAVLVVSILPVVLVYRMLLFFAVYYTQR